MDRLRSDDPQTTQKEPMIGSYHGFQLRAWAAATLIRLSPKSTSASDLLFAYGMLRKPKTRTAVGLAACPYSCARYPLPSPHTRTGPRQRHQPSTGHNHISLYFISSYLRVRHLKEPMTSNPTAFPAADLPYLFALNEQRSTAHF